MTTSNDGGPAFARGSSSAMSQQGMSLRDYFAGQTLAGAMANPNLCPTSVPELQHLARRSYEAADAMLAARGGKAE